MWLHPKFNQNSKVDIGILGIACRNPIVRAKERQHETLSCIDKFGSFDTYCSSKKNDVF